MSSFLTFKRDYRTGDTMQGVTQGDIVYLCWPIAPSLYESQCWVHSHAPSIRSHRGTKVVFLDIQPMRASKEPDCVDIFRQNSAFTSLHLRSPVHVVPPMVEIDQWKRRKAKCECDAAFGTIFRINKYLQRGKQKLILYFSWTRQAKI